MQMRPRLGYLSSLPECFYYQLLPAVGSYIEVLLLLSRGKA